MLILVGNLLLLFEIISRSENWLIGEFAHKKNRAGCGGRGESEINPTLQIDFQKSTSTFS
jgi:hypothetical protein